MELKGFRDFSSRNPSVRFVVKKFDVDYFYKTENKLQDIIVMILKKSQIPIVRFLGRTNVP